VISHQKAEIEDQQSRVHQPGSLVAILIADG